MAQKHHIKSIPKHDLKFKFCTITVGGNKMFTSQKKFKLKFLVFLTHGGPNFFSDRNLLWIYYR